MLINKKKCCAGVLLTVLLAACGGGGGGSSFTPVTSTETFQLRTAWVNYLTDSRSLPFTVSGTSSGIRITGSGTLTQGGLSAGVFEGVSAIQKTSVVTGSITSNGTTAALSTSTTEFVDSDYYPLGSSGYEYTVVNGTATIPQTAMVNDTGTLFTENRYQTSAKAALLGTNTMTYIVEPDSATTALLKLIEVEKSTAGTTTGTTTITYRMTPSGGLTRLSEVYSDSTDTLTITY
jgi:hypothetical protein